MASSDCESQVCTNNVCQAPTANDGVQNGDETDVDCGGANADACEEGQACNNNADCVSDDCSNNVCNPCKLFVGWASNDGDTTHSSIWQFQGLSSVAAANAMCAQLNANAHACTYTEVVAAEAQGDFADEFTNNAGGTAWVHRVNDVTVNGVTYPAGAGTRCDDWTYGSGHAFDGEYMTITANGLQYVLDPDPTAVGAASCGGSQRNIACCQAATACE